MFPLWVAAQGGHVKVLLELLRSGADVKMRDLEGRSPLHIAAKNGQETVVKILLAQEADTRSTDLRGCTAAFAAAQQGHLDVLSVRTSFLGTERRSSRSHGRPGEL